MSTTASPAQILIADDDEVIAMLIADALEDEGFSPIVCHTGAQTLHVLSTHPDLALLILDIMMPGPDGLAILRQVRGQLPCPILLVTARNRTADTLQGLDLGADDYIAKPFVLAELVARVKAHLRRERRKTQALQPESTAPAIHIGEITLLPDDFEVFVSGRRVDLTTREFQLLHYLAANIGQILRREEIFRAVWGSGFGDASAVAVYIRSLRQKLGEAGRHIKTIWGAGYQLSRQIERQIERDQ
jgi:DNA-binding response OmpR family regulator